MMLCFWALTHLIIWTCCSSSQILIGIVLSDEQRDSDIDMILKYTVMQINQNPTILSNITLDYIIKYAKSDDSFHTAKQVCEQIEYGVCSILGPSDALLGEHVQSICDTLDIPHIDIRLNVDHKLTQFRLSLHPSHLDITEAYQNLITYLNWTKMSVVYEDDISLMKLQTLVRATPNVDMEIYIRQASAQEYRNVLQEIKNKEIYNIIVDIQMKSIATFLRAILQLQMNDFHYHYLFTSFDTETFDLEDFSYNAVNITAFRIVDADDLYVRHVLDIIRNEQPFGSGIVKSNSVIKAETALMHDSVQVFARAMHRLMGRPQLLIRPNITCDRLTPWLDGSAVVDSMNEVKIKGLTGPIRFKRGQRVDFKLDLLKLIGKKMTKVGVWDKQHGINLTDKNAFNTGARSNVTLLVATIQEVPYVMKHVNETNGEIWFDGFCIDLLERIAKLEGFKYKIVEEPSKLFGTYNPKTKKWNGLVHTIMNKKADLAVASMTISYAREAVVDFTKPFMNLGISILFKVPTSQPTRLFSFMNPLAVEIWLYVMTAYILVSLTMFVMARFSPYEWNNPQPCYKNNDIIENQFNMSNSFWFITGTLLRQGSGLNPKAMSTRIVGSIWWFFTLIIISSYTANLAAFLTVERTSTPIENAADLSNQDEIEYGTLEGGSTMTFFRDSKIDIYQKMWTFMKSRKKSVFVSDYHYGVERVLAGNYAFLMESTGLDYIVQRNCNLTQVGGLLDSKGYGIATPVGSLWRDKISLAILDLQEKGVIQMLYNKWWKDTGDVCNRDEKKQDSKASALGIENIGGVFVVLLCGLALAIAVSLLEFCWSSSKNAQTKQQSLCNEMATELKFAMRCHAPPRRPALRRECSQCNNLVNNSRINYGSSSVIDVHKETYVPTSLEQKFNSVSACDLLQSTEFMWQSQFANNPNNDAISRLSTIPSPSYTNHTIS